MGIVIWGPESLPEFRQRSLAILAALLAGFAGYFLSGDLRLSGDGLKTRFGVLNVKATGGISLFLIVLVWWLSPMAPVEGARGGVNKEKIVSNNFSNNRLEIKKTTVLESNPGKHKNIALQKNTSITGIIDQSFGRDINWKRLIDGNLVTDIRLDYHLLKKTKIKISFPKAHVVGISFHQPSSHSPDDFLKIVKIKAQYLAGNWSEEKLVELPKDIVPFDVELELDQEVVALLIKLEDNQGGNDVYIGDIKVWADRKIN